MKNIPKINFKNIRLLITIILFVIGFIFVSNITSEKLRENFEGNDCPNLLIQENNEIYLHNTKKKHIPGVNPLRFNNLEEYVEFLNWQKSQGIRCPVLFLQKSIDSQGESIYSIRPSPTDLQGGLNPSDNSTKKKYNSITKLLDSHHDDMPYNVNSYPGYDAQNQYIGENTPLDKMFNNDSKISANPMDTNWGGASYTEQLVKTKTI